ncbi:MAG TPA: crossover junction endodeoxyribonuclease RuvC [Aggregatilineales bacterium]|nr:crossover junction endodeoxyribonuclease RuvC [Aggregatilineales bacterium]
MLSLGIDPGTATIGYGLVSELNDGSLQAIAYGVITTSPKDPMWRRLHIIHDTLKDIIEKFKPDRIAIEELFFAKNITTALTVAQGRGVILLTAAQANLTIVEYKPNEVKQSITGYGAAKKPQIQEMVRLLLGLDDIPKPDDAADALAIAITDIHQSRYTLLE